MLAGESEPHRIHRVANNVVGPPFANVLTNLRVSPAPDTGQQGTSRNSLSDVCLKLPPLLRREATHSLFLDLKQLNGPIEVFPVAF